jgi:AcrR family transcriptional regulator
MTVKSERDASDRRSRRSRRLIAESLIELMAEVRYDRITVQQIIDRADVGRSTFYAHFRDKEDVLISESERVLAHFHDRLEPDGAGDQRLFPSLGLFRHVGEQHRLFHALVRGHAIDAVYRAWQRYLCAGLERRLAELDGDRDATSVPLPILSGYVAGTFLGLVRWWLEQGRPYSAEQMDTFFQGLVLPGVQAAVPSYASESDSPGQPPHQASR